MSVTRAFTIDLQHDKKNCGIVMFNHYSKDATLCTRAISDRINAQSYLFINMYTYIIFYYINFVLLLYKYYYFIFEDVSKYTSLNLFQSSLLHHLQRWDASSQLMHIFDRTRVEERFRHFQSRQHLGVIKVSFVP